MIENSQSRSELISSQNIGLGESWSRNKEAEIINNAGLVTSINTTIAIEKEWVAILDSKTRSQHANADGQRVTLDSNFIVGGESLKFPRDPNGSVGNIINCRCIADYDTTEI